MGSAISFSILSLFAELLFLCGTAVRRIRTGSQYTPNSIDFGLCGAGFALSLCAFLFPASYVMMSAGWSENAVFSASIAGASVFFFVLQLAITLVRIS